MMVALAHDTGVDTQWYKDAIIYQLHVKSFCDSNGDGIGDFPGLISKLDYLVDLGVNVIWLLPFYPSPRRDDGYDISDYRGVHPDYGTLADVRKLIRAAHERGIRIITELVINHTSDQHAWFQRARHAPPNSVRRNYYVWSDDDTAYAGTRVIFCDSESSNWAWDDVARAWYWHRFYSHQPDLNYDNPAVLREMIGIMRFWLTMGIDGMRLDAVPYLVEREGTSNENLPETHAILRHIRAAMEASFPDRVLIAEANQWPEDVQEYFGNGDECHMAFHFPVMPRMYMAIAREDRFPVTDILRQTPQIPDNCQWAIFLRNHDELTLEMVTSAERDYLWETYAADRRARLNFGIRRRLAPLLQGDRRRIELMNSLLLSLPGTPIIYYGDEIGMGDNIHLGDRDGVRTPMQWRPDRNGGFSSADPEQLVLPALMDPLYGYATVNVEAQSRNPHSLLNWSRRMLGLRRQHSAFGRGRFEFIFPGNRKVLAYLRIHDEVILCVANLSHAPQAVELDLSAYEGRVPVELTAGSTFPPIGKLTYLLTLPPHGFYWFVLSEDADPPQWHDDPPELMPEYTTLVMRQNRPDIDAPDIRMALENECLPPYLRVRRWFGAKQTHALRPELGHAINDKDSGVLFTEVDTHGEDGNEHYLLPMSIVWDDEPNTALEQQLAMARVRCGSRVGMLTDAFSEPAFARRVLALMCANATIESDDGGALHFRHTAAMQQVEWPPNVDVRWISVEQSNSSLVIAERGVLKLLRRCWPGVQPEAEMTGYLTSQGFAHAPRLLGTLVRSYPDGREYTYAVLLEFVSNQGDGWNWIQNLLRQLVDEHVVDRTSDTNGFGILMEHETFCAAVGLRLGQLHAVLARPSEDPMFAPQPIDTKDVQAWSLRCEKWMRRAHDALAMRDASHDAALDALAMEVTQRIRQWLDALASGVTLSPHGYKTRIHGDFHLGQVLVANGDAWLIDFEGAPATPLNERRSLQSPLVDVAGMLRSIDYAAASALRFELAQVSPVLEQRRHELVSCFAEHARKEFLRAYLEGGGAALDRDLLQCFMLEKAAYEICYEMDNRPGWLDVPLHGMRALLDGHNEVPA